MNLKIGAIAEQLGTTVRTLRFYEEQGLVHPRRSLGGTRQYDDEDAARFTALFALTRLGFSLERLAQLAGMRAASRSGDAASRAVAAQLEVMDAELASREQAIAEQRADIARAQAFLAGCHGCDCQPVRTVCDGCAVSAGQREIGVMRVVWDERRPD